MVDLHDCWKVHWPPMALATAVRLLSMAAGAPWRNPNWDRILTISFARRVENCHNSKFPSPDPTANGRRTAIESYSRTWSRASCGLPFFQSSETRYAMVLIDKMHVYGVCKSSSFGYLGVRCVRMHLSLGGANRVYQFAQFV